MTLFLGIDAGGTGARYVVLDQDRMVASGEAGAIQVTGREAGGVAALSALIEAASGEVGGQRFTGIVAGLAGAGHPGLRRELQSGLLALGVTSPLTVVGDVVTAVASSYAGGPMVVLQVGTGSFAVGVDRSGSLHRIGGRGWLLGDEGGGFDIVRSAATAVVRAVDGLGPGTALAQALTDRFAASGPDRLGVAMQNLPAGEVASALPIVLAVAAGGDVVAAEVVSRAGQRLAELVRAAATRTGHRLRDLRLFVGGGAMSAGSILKSALAAELRADLVERLESPGTAPAVGAARLAAALHRQEQPQTGWCLDA